MADLSKSPGLHLANTFLTIALTGVVILFAIFDPDAGSGKPRLLAGALSVYALYLALSSLVTRRILGQLVFIERDQRPEQFWLFFGVYLAGAVALGAFSLLS
ncbi:MAG: hypothetical protein KDJ29_02995 [Hyphomicrobiales bacterium]|nr:hypothetical protein [Hyphomicrobiales bacterium]